MELPPKPASPLGVHQILSTKAGVRVSPLCLYVKHLSRELTPVYASFHDIKIEIIDNIDANLANKLLLLQWSHEFWRCLESLHGRVRQREFIRNNGFLL